MLEVDLIRHNLQIDPHLDIWGWQVSLYLFLGGLTAGVMILTALLRLIGKADALSRWARWLPFAAPVAISIGMLMLFLDLAHKEHVWRFFMTWRPLSPMSWGAWILIAIYPATILLGLRGLTTTERDALAGWTPLRALRLGGLVRWAHGLAACCDRFWSWANIVLGIGLGTYTGLLIGTLAARPAWNSLLLGPLFLVSGLSAGAAFMMLFGLDQDERHQLQRWDVVAIVTELVLLGLFLLSLATSGGAAGSAAAGLFFGGTLTAPFWSLVIVAGLLAPLSMELVEKYRGLRPTLVAPALILFGGLSLRAILVVAGQT